MTITLQTLPPPVIEEIEGILVVRDDLIPGGTKRRVLDQLLSQSIDPEFVYASPAYGYAQVALAYSCTQLGRQATIFTAKRKELHPRTLEAKRAGAKIVMVPTGYLSNVQAKAKSYCEQSGAQLLPFGLDTPYVVSALAKVARGLPITPTEVWSVAGSGVLTRALQLAWPGAKFFTVQVGKDPQAGRAVVYKAPEDFEQDARIKPPFPSCSNYDAKAWQFIKRHASKGALFWNVAA
jgi:hypothetical protein